MAGSPGVVNRKWVGVACGVAAGFVLGAGTVGLVARARNGSLNEQTMYLEPLGRPREPGGTVDQREARLAAMALADQNEGLRGEMAELEGHVRQLTVALASVRAEADVLKARTERGELEVETPAGGAVALSEAEIRVIDVNPALRMVVLDGGSAHGIRPGMVFQVVRGGRPIAAVRAVDVRALVTGAVIEDAEDDGRPEHGDRAVHHPRAGG